MQYLILLLLISSIKLTAQSDYNQVDKYAKKLHIKTKNTLKIAHQLTNQFETEEEKIRAIYIWIGSNIEYDWDLYRNKKLRYKLAKKKAKKRIKRTLRKRMAICHGYSELFKVLAHASDIDCEVIEGYSKTKKTEIGRIKKADHAWNIAKIDGIWYLFDVTWSRDYIIYPAINGNIGHPYFMANPEKFNYNHLPINEYWKLNTYGIDKEEFGKLPLVHNGFFTNNFDLHEESKNGVMITRVNQPFSIRFSSENKPFLSQIKLGRRLLDGELVEVSEGEYEFKYSFNKKGNYYSEIYLDGIKTITYLVKVKP